MNVNSVLAFNRLYTEFDILSFMCTLHFKCDGLEHDRVFREKVCLAKLLNLRGILRYTVKECLRFSFYH